MDIIVNYVLDHFAQKTRRSSSYLLKDQRVMGFNSTFATASIDMAKVYYSAFRRIQDERGGERLKVALIICLRKSEGVRIPSIAVLPKGIFSEKLAIMP